MIRRKREGEIPVLDDSELEIIKRGIENANIITDYFFRPFGEDRGFIFDDNFTPEGAWQLAVHQAKQTDIIVVGGFASGKTLGIGMSAVVYALTTYPDFRFLDVAPTTKQAMYMYNKIITLSKGTPFEKMIFSAPTTPWPKIEIKYWFHDTLVESQLEFASLDKDAHAISGDEVDMVCIDEAFLVPDLEGVLSILGSRIRGSVKGRERLARLVMITNSHDNPYGWQLWELAATDPEGHLSMRISSRHNKNVTSRQLAAMVSRIPPEERERYIEGLRPEGKGIYFDSDSVLACEDPYIGDIAISNFKAKEPGWNIRVMHGAGVVYYTEPYEKGHTYVMFGDPGTSNAPNRNSPVWMIWDVTDFPSKPARLAVFWWGSGKGTIIPFIGTLVRLLLLYRPSYIGIDSTGPQKNSVTVINLHLRGNRINNPEILSWLGPDIPITDKGVKIPKDTIISGMDFSVGKKNAYLFSGKMMIETGKFSWPRIITGIRAQLGTYDPALDRGSLPSFPQDIVATIAMSAHAIQALFAIELPPLGDDDEEDETSFDNVSNRLSRSSGRGGREGIQRVSR